VRLKADVGQLNLPHGTKNFKKWKKKKLKMKIDMITVRGVSPKEEEEEEEGYGGKVIGNRTVR